MELLAPAGNIENFHAALLAGADAVYVGAPGINARNLSRDLSLEEIWAMIDFAHQKGKKVFLAANSLILERELPTLIETLAVLEKIQPDALIVQDFGLMQLIRHHFPDLTMYGSTLMGASSSESVKALGAMGCKRVVLARELTLKEIYDIRRKTEIDLEIFIHGAMCYSYSGLCLFSSFLGGKSGLRGRCVQPCRRAYSWRGQGGKKKGGRGGGGGSYIFSMNDLAGFEAVAQLKEIGISSLKIEGRLRSANYVSKIVEAYRLVIDANDSERHRAIATATKLADEAMGRKTSSGYFFSPQPPEAITPQHSGNMGLHLGSFFSIGYKKGSLLGKIKLKYPLNIGDRLRLHIESSGERKAFTVHQMLLDGKEAESAPSGGNVQIFLPADQEAIETSRVELFKLDGKKSSTPQVGFHEAVVRFRKKFEQIHAQQKNAVRGLQRHILPTEQMAGSPDPLLSGGKGKKGITRSNTPELWLRVESDKLVTGKLPFQPDVFVLSFDKRMLSQSANIKRFLGKRSRNVVWALPPVMWEKDIGRYRKQVSLLIRSGFRSFQLGHISQTRLFGRERVHLYGGYTLNLANSQALSAASAVGLEGTQVAVEMDRTALALLIRSHKNRTAETGARPVGHRKIRLGLTVYGALPLFTSRLNSQHFQFNKNLVSPKNEEFYLTKKDGMVATVPTRPFSLLGCLPELQDMGLDYVVIDTTSHRMGEKELKELADRISGTGKFRKLPTFNYLGKLE